MKDPREPGTKKILIVDDEPLILFGLSRTFQDLAEVKTVNTGEKACDEIAANFYNLCFLDIYLPGMNGLEVMERIQERSPETKIVVMSAFADENMKKRIEKSACMLLEKPFDLSSIKNIVKETLL
ncbi:MAG: response regulator [bacterium]